ncbi:MAG: hypothetical protein SVQ76_02260 [Candidatus Nanohaloarchaea archaeon]|nr:hypothetical protein [Candidatus Nanohaloarchaea archaeon]
MKLQKQERGDAIQFTITVPKRYADDFGWEHQQELRWKLVERGRLILEDPE